MSIFEHTDFDNHETISFASEKDSNLKAIIAVHSTALGPAAGGTRFWTYASSEDALADALRLSRAMSLKNAIADIPHGGGKGVIMKPEGEFNRRALFSAYGSSLNRLNGAYYTAEDVGVSPDDMQVISTQTAFVAGLEEGGAASGDPSPVTAKGVFQGLKVAIRHRLQKETFDGLTVAVQGLGSVGYALCEHLFKDGAKLIVTDINDDTVQKAVQQFKAKAVGIDKIFDVQADIFAPCALGGALNEASLPRLKVSIIGGAANNQLKSTEIGQRLHDMGLVYCPDYVINGGGIINVAAELSGTYDAVWVDKKLEALSQTLDNILKQSQNADRPTHLISDEMALDRIKSKSA